MPLSSSAGHTSPKRARGVQPIAYPDVRTRCLERLAQGAAIRTGERVLIISDSSPELPCADACLDAFLCLADASSLSAVRSQLADWRQALRPGGRIGLALFPSTNGSDPEDCRDAFREAGFDDIDVRAHAEMLARNPASTAVVSAIYAVAWNRPR